MYICVDAFIKEKDSFCCACFRSRNEARKFAERIADTGSIGLCSIGSGQSILEWQLEEFFPQQVVLVEVAYDVICQEMKENSGVSVVLPGSGAPLPLVRPEHALLFCYGTRADWKAYVAEYRGSCVVIISDSDPASCSPSCKNKDDAKFLKDKGFEEIFVDSDYDFCGTLQQEDDEGRQSHNVSIWQRTEAECDI